MANNSDSSNDQAIRGRWPVLDILLGKKASDGPRTDAEKDVRRAEYEAFNTKLNDMRVGRYAHFLNLGYVPNDNPTFCAVDTEGHQLDPHSRRLVLEVLGEGPIDGMDVLDVSCGRGALAVVLKQSFQPKSYCGVDLSPQAIKFCETHHASDAYRFLEGDAEQLPCDDGSMDVVVNIEASHNFPHIDAFFREVHRVLRPGGWFLYADVLAPAMFEQNQGLLNSTGFTTERNLDITSNVMLSSDQVGAMRLKIYDDPEVRAYMADFLFVPGSETYRALDQGQLQYRLYRLRRTG